MKKLTLLFAGLLLIQTSNAQIFKKLGEKINDKINRTIGEKIDKKIDKTVNKTAEKVEEAVTKTAKKSGKDKSKSDTAETSLSKNMEVNEKAERADVSTQDCDPEILRQKPGTWKAGLVGSIKNVTATDLAKEKAVMANVHNMLFTGYKPMGNQSSYNTAFGKHVVAGDNWLADPYYYTIYILSYLCDPKVKNKHYVQISTSTNVTISANVFFPIDLYPVLPVNGPRGYLGLKTMPIKKNGHYFMGEEIDIDRKVKSTNWLITYDDVLPFVYLTRKEYLLIQKKRIDQELKNNPGSKDYYIPFINNVDNFLKKSEAELSKIAIYNPQEEERFEGFMNEGDKYSLIAIKPNPAYYNKKLSMSSPQFFSVEYQVAYGSSNHVDNMEAITKAVDFDKLKSMLGK